MSHKEKYNKKYGFPKDKSHSLSAIAKTTGIPLSNIRKIYEKGSAARRNNPQSVRRSSDGKKVGGSSLRGKMSANQWSMARVYSAVTGGKAAKVDKDLIKKTPHKKKPAKSAPKK